MKGWDFEFKVLLQAGCILLGGCVMAAGMMGPNAFLNEVFSSQYPTLWQFVLMMTIIISGFILIRRSVMYSCLNNPQKIIKKYGKRNNE